MKVKRRYNQIRRDLIIDLECESCGAIETGRSAYDDRHFWDRVVPDIKCKGCGKSTSDLGIAPVSIATRYDEHEVV